MELITVNPNNVELARKCLELIRDIADRGASSWDPEQVGYALQELSQVLLARTGCDERLFEPVAADRIPHLRCLCEELAFVNDSSQGMMRPH